MKRFMPRARSIWTTSLCLLFLAGVNAAAADKKDVINQARNAYYSLRTQGLSEFQCDMTPNWDALLADAKKANPQAADSAISMLRQLQFTVSVGSTGSAKVTHNTVAAGNDQMAAGLKQIYSGMEQMTTGFFDTWSPFMIGSPFPKAEGDYELTDHGDVWNLSYQDGTTQVLTTMTKSLVIRETKVTSPQFTSSIRPQFKSSSQGLLLAGYDADYLGKSPSETTHLQVGISYQTVNGFQLPEKLNLSGSYGDTPFQVEVTFSGCTTNPH